MSWLLPQATPYGEKADFIPANKLTPSREMPCILLVHYFTFLNILFGEEFYNDLLLLVFSFLFTLARNLRYFSKDLFVLLVS